MDFFWKRNTRIPVSEPNLGRRERKYLLKAYDSKWIAKGEYVDKFEEAFAKYVGVKHAIACSSGTTALHLAYQAIFSKTFSTILIPNLTFVATANAAITTGMSPRFTDVKEDTWLMNPEEIKFSPSMVIVPVHLYGNPCDMDSIMNEASKRKAIVIEDACQSLGSTYNGKQCGSLGHISVFSFFGNKVITTGEGGMVCTDQPRIAAHCRALRNHRMTEGYEHDGLGFNYRMTNLQAAIGCAQLERLPEFLEKKRWIAKYYRENLDSKKFLFQKYTKNGISNDWMTTIQVLQKDQFINHMKVEGIETRSVFVPMGKLPHLENSNCNISKIIHSMGISLPSGTTLSKKDTERVVKTANAFRPF
jgi:perosamine synthetase